MFSRKSFLIAVIFCIGFLALNFKSLQFRSSNIALALPAKLETHLAATGLHTRSILNHSFSYLGEGNQAYAFISADKKFVLKFFKNSPLNSNNWLELLSFVPFVDQYFQKNHQRALRKYHRVFNAYEIAYLHDRQHCGLQCIHLHQSAASDFMIHIIDRFGISHAIDLNIHAFVIQKMAVPLKNILKKELKEGKIELVKLQLKKVVEMYLEEYQNGIFDHDHNLMVNIGFIAESPMRIDVGKLVLDLNYQSKEFYLKDLDKIIHQRIAKWLDRHFPEYTEEIVLTLEPYLDPTRYL